MRTTDAGLSGVSGNIDILTGTSSGGATGSITISTGPATNAQGGDINLLVGMGDEMDGGNIQLVAGTSTAQAHSGGFVRIKGGDGANTQVSYCLLKSFSYIISICLIYKSLFIFIYYYYYY